MRLLVCCVHDSKNSTIEWGRKCQGPEVGTCSTNQRVRKEVKDQVSALPHRSSKLSSLSLHVPVRNDHGHNWFALHVMSAVYFVTP